MENRLDPELLKILACPACRKPLAQPDEKTLTCAACGRRYPVESGIPRLIVES
jgi:uncharacterized protein YbaR (Trm112 family)